MDHIILAENRVRMVSHFGCFKAAALIYAHINNYRIGFHAAYRFLGYNAGATAVGRAHGANSNIAGGNGFFQHNWLHYRGKYPAAYIILQTAQFINRWIEHLYL